MSERDGSSGGATPDAKSPALPPPKPKQRVDSSVHEPQASEPPSLDPSDVSELDGGWDVRELDGGEQPKPVASERVTLDGETSPSQRPTLDPPDGAGSEDVPIHVDGLDSAPPPQISSISYLGTTIDGRYRVERLLGEGGMGYVYRCRHKVIDKVVAIKILRQDVPRARDVMDRFVVEAQAASAIGNAHIVDVLDFGHLPDGSTFFVMEYLEGLSLGQVMDEQQPLAISRIVSIGKQIAEGLGAAHDAKIVHRDLKPDNVFLIDREGRSDFVKILDFGIAKVGTFQSKITRAGEIFGTPHYMSPEQAKGIAVDLRADIYSVGVILYEMLKGKVPFDAESPFGILTQHITAEPASICATHPNVPAGLEAIVLKCLSKRREQRYQSMAELIGELEKVERGASPSASAELAARAAGKASSIPPTFASPAQRRWPVYAAALFLLGGGGGLAYAVTLAPATSASKIAADVRLASRTESMIGVARRTAPASASGRQVAMILAPIDAHAFQRGNDLGAMPVTVEVPPDEVVEIQVKRQGFFTRKIKLDGKKPRVVVRLAPIPGVKLAVPVPKGQPVAAGEGELAEEVTDETEATEEPEVESEARPAPAGSGAPAKGPATKKPPRGKPPRGKPPGEAAPAEPEAT